MKRLLLVAMLAWLSPVWADADGFVENAGQVENFISGTIVLRDREVSAVNTAQTFVYDIRGIVNVIAIVATCSSGTATLTVSGSSDDTNFITIDSIAAASPQVKQYNNTSTGASTAVTPIAFRWVKISVGACGASNTSTLTVAGK